MSILSVPWLKELSPTAVSYPGPYPSLHRRFTDPCKVNSQFRRPIYQDFYGVGTRPADRFHPGIRFPDGADLDFSFSA